MSMILPLNDDERKELNLKAARWIKSLGIPINVTENRFDAIREKQKWVGFASYYLSYGSNIA